MSISAVYCCMGREKNLRLSIKSVLQFKEISEIIVLDYGSKIPVKQFFSKKIRLYRLDAPYWHLTRAYNMAIQLSTNEVVIKLDCDYFLKSSFFRKNLLQKNCFVSGDNIINQNLSGFLMFYKKDFLSINGYNEKIVNYGYDDNDIRNRLISKNIKQLLLDHETVSHIYHGNDERKINNKDKYLSFDESVNQNKILSMYDWTNYGKMSVFQ